MPVAAVPAETWNQEPRDAAQLSRFGVEVGVRAYTAAGGEILQRSPKVHDGRADLLVFLPPGCAMTPGILSDDPQLPLRQSTPPPGGEDAPPGVGALVVVDVSVRRGTSLGRRPFMSAPKAARLRAVAKASFAQWRAQHGDEAATGLRVSYDALVVYVRGQRAEVVLHHDILPQVEPGRQALVHGRTGTRAPHSQGAGASGGARISAVIPVGSVPIVPRIVARTHRPAQAVTR
ncbi:hypothetical protein C1Y63_00415 [Corynebacterium sp. 13CS0277]|nr:hypothetical protein C1Y63_00415 [Corynebacterium sp. 13CS0277]